MKRHFKLFVSLFFLCMLVQNFYGENKKALTVRIDQIIPEDYPDMTAYAVVKNEKNDIVSGLAPGLFSFRIDTEEAKVVSKITPFTMLEESVDYTILVSNNGIMEGEPFDFQKNAILKFVELMNDNDTLSVYTIGEDAGAVIENTARKAFDSAVINKIELSDAQPRLYDSIINLLRKVEQKKAKRKIIIILSDGRDQNSRFTKDQMMETLSNSGFPIYTVGMKVLSNQHLSNLDEISQITGGTYYYTPRIKDLPESLKKVIECIKQSYVIKLKVKSLKADNQIHILEVKVEETESAGKGLKTFVAVKHPVPKWVKIVLLIVAILLVIAGILLVIFRRISKRKKMGITKRKCADCGNIMKDSWEDCPFCKYMPNLKKSRKSRKEK